MSLTRVFTSPLRYRPWRLRHARLIADDLLARRNTAEKRSTEHLSAAIDWLCRAQDVRQGRPDAGGVSAGWSFEDGWLPSYPETTGYIIETFVAASALLNRPELVTRAQRMIDWELSIQQQDGAFPGHFGEPGSRPVIFNTGQIMHGMLAGALQLQRPECLEAAVRAGHWLAKHQEGDGCWRKFEHNDIPHTYNTRATWALVATGLVAGETKLVRAARSHLEWALAQRTPTGWFANNGFTPNQEPFTHTIAYAIRGFLECGVLLQDARCIDVARRAATAVAGVQRQDGWIAGTLGAQWRSGARYACVTGIAQMALCWMRIAQTCGADDLRENARRGISYVKRSQRLNESDGELVGGFPGSVPIWGAYSRFEFPNWAAKFAADAIMMERVDRAIPPVATALPTTPVVMADA